MGKGAEPKGHRGAAFWDQRLQPCGCGPGHTGPPCRQDSAPGTGHSGDKCPEERGTQVCLLECRRRGEARSPPSLGWAGRLEGEAEASSPLQSRGRWAVLCEGRGGTVLCAKPAVPMSIC